MARQEFSKRVKRDGFARSGGRCEAILPNGERCGCKLFVGKFTYDHRVPDRLGGEPILSNLQVICEACDKAKYSKDRRDIDHNRRMSDRNLGIRLAPKRPVQSARFDKAAPQRKASAPLSRPLPQRARPLITGA